MTQKHKALPRLLKRDAMDRMMFGFVRGIKKFAPNVTSKRCIELFCHEFNIQEDFNIHSAEVTYNRMNHEFIEMMKSEKKDG